jgi:ABC-type lipoprotein export system ATPase subunit
MALEEQSGSLPQSLYVEPERNVAEVAPPALECIDVFKIFRSGPVETVALRGLDVRIEAGELVAILGPSGCGKSTFLSLAAALDVPSAGELRCWGRPLGLMDEAELAKHRANKVAIVFQSENLWPSLSARENVVTSLKLAGHERPGTAAAASLAAFGLGERESHPAAKLSGGEQQRVAIAAAAARSAPLVLADEPTGELDEETSARVLALLRERASEGAAVVVVTHDPDVAARADRTVRLRDGKVEQ